MKRVAKPVFFIVALLIAFFFYSSWFGVKGKNGDNTVTYLKGAEDIRLGTDIRGGVESTFSPATSTKPTEEQMNSAEATIKERLIGENVTDYEVYTDYNHSRIIVRFPWKTDEKNYDPKKAIDELAATAQVTFREGFEYTTKSTGSDGSVVYKTPKGATASNIILKGDDIVHAEPEMTRDSNGKATYVVSLQLSADGAKKFADATEKMVGQTISIWMDDTAISWPTVQEEISGGKCQIDGGSTGFTAAEASSLANKINAGALPFKLTATSSSTINPTLGMSSLNAMKLAGLIAFILIAVFMLLIFRLPGLIADISMLGQIALTFAAVSGYFPFVNSFTLTLPGIAGLILSIGMGVDANIITDTRIKEELWAGKTLDYSIAQGNKNSFSAIFDGNITTVIVALLLMLVFGPKNILSYWFGASLTGAIYSFGYTLLIGIIGNFIFGVGTTRLMLKSISRFGFARNKWLYGGTVPDKAFKIRFYENRRKYFAVSLTIIVVGLIFNGIFGTKLDINFRGGAAVKYSYSGTIDANKIEQAVQNAVHRDVTVTLGHNNTGTNGASQNNATLSFAGNQSLSTENQKAVDNAINQAYPKAGFENIETSSINPSMGSTFFAKCLVAVLIAFILLDIYTAIRFRKIGGMAAGVFAIVALLNDVAMVYFTFIFFRIPLDNNFIAVALTILGYSLNDTIVIYDRIRENRKLYGPKTGYNVLVNTSVDQTLSRSLYTAGSTVMSVITILVVGCFYNLSSISTFALPMMIGVISGCYSSICIASPLYVMWENHKTKKLAMQNVKQTVPQIDPQAETGASQTLKPAATVEKKKSGKKNTGKKKKH